MADYQNSSTASIDRELRMDAHVPGTSSQLFLPASSAA